MNKLTNLIKSIVTAAVVLALANCASQQSSVVETVPAPEIAAEEQTIIITGSRIKRSDSEAAQIVENFIERLDRHGKGVVLSDNQDILSIYREKTQLTYKERQDFYRVIDVDPRASHQIFKRYRVNPTINTINKPTSTFSMDVDNGSFKLAKTMLSIGQLPNADGIRIEEFVNAMDYQYQPSEDLFAVSAEAMPSPFRNGYHILHLGLQTKALSDSERNPSNLVIVADISGSMNSDNKLTLLKDSMTTLVSQLNRDDKIALVTYNDDAQLVLSPTRASNKRKIFRAINKLKAGGSTNAEKGLLKGYQLANEMFAPGFNNRVILTSDGMANVGSTSPEAILNKISEYKNKGIFLTTLGVGVGIYNDHLLEQLANKGNGNYLYVANQSDIQDAFVDQLNSQLQTVAKDAKIQVKFDPAQVSSYRLLGYENRHLNEQDFTDPNKDGGEIGAGHKVTALYEIKINDESSANTPVNQTLGQLSIAYKKPQGQKVHYITKPLPGSIISSSVGSASADSRLSFGVAAFAEKLRQSYWARLYSYYDVERLIANLPPSYRRSNQVKKLKELIQVASRLDHRDDPFEARYPKSTIDFDRVPLLD
ncbi:vWA domain-containing protein [Aliikangiella coralliicola]|uniref:DUF3520 domain-containing protein n=1 Tax=Aliikangiella coralliicola TaxID=2592383 RepID=A0A545UEX2_9GAMM|nr:von Willebrand factor type A domain-containing protein [Aliikangiella coralliicola]TQV88026.1 DUF3520 domain-containing protein [Aliikangiella coralliicola]